MLSNKKSKIQEKRKKTHFRPKKSKVQEKKERTHAFDQEKK